MTLETRRILRKTLEAALTRAHENFYADPSLVADVVMTEISMAPLRISLIAKAPPVPKLKPKVKKKSKRLHRSSPPAFPTDDDD